ncbi:MAG TPA: AraC family transcriptional regulator [Opitutaceae bacterium]|nr:AraC family transcriptional regulator [Opitutaceae bacterium]
MPRRAPRGEGFVGQHMIVLPEPLRERAERAPLLRGLHVTDAGYFPAAAGHCVERADGAPTTLVILCLRGTGWVETEDRSCAVETGDFVWLDARRPHAYGAAARSPWTISWAHFAGTEVGHWRDFLQTCGADYPVQRLPRDHVDAVDLDGIHAELDRGLATRHQIAAAAALRGSLIRIGEILVERPGQRSARERVVSSVAMLRKEWLRPHRLEELATGAGMSVTHYCAHFREVTGFAPIDFLIRLRVQRACRLLDTSSLTVAAVAAAVGYTDPYYFTRCFRRVMGCAPQQYRKVLKG